MLIVNRFCVFLIGIRNNNILKFIEFGFMDILFEGLSVMGFEEVILIQELVIFVIMDGKDVLGCVQIGMGKIVVFLFLILNCFIVELYKGMDIFIIGLICELIQQVDCQLEGFFYFIFVSFIFIYGGCDGVLME